MALSDNLQAYYKLENSSDSVNSYNLTISGATLSSDGLIGSCYDFDGSNDYAYVDTNPTHTNNVSLSCWIVCDNTNNALIFSSKRPAGAYAASLNIIGGKLGLDLYNGINNPTARATSFTVSNSTWYHIVGTYNGSQMKFYINGQLQATTDETNSYSGEGLYLGRYPGNTFYFNGRIDEAGMWDRVLSGDEISELYNSGAGLTYPFSEEPPAGWSKKINNITAGKINNIAVASISKVNGV